MREIAQSKAGRVLPLLIATLVVGVGAYFVCLSAIDKLQSSQAEYMADNFAKYLDQELPDLPGIVDGSARSESSDQALATIKPIGAVFKFRIYNPTGRLRVDSSLFAAGHVVDPRDSFEDMTARRVAATQRPSFVLRHGDGRVLPIYYSEVMVPLHDGTRPIGVLSVLSDETQSWPSLLGEMRSVIGQVIALILVAFAVPVTLYLRKQGQLELARRRLTHSVLHDELTGTLNRQGFLESLSEHVEQAASGAISVGVHVIDLDRFKDINSGSGHSAGDEVLREAARRLRALVGARERMARLGADEFAILQPYDPGAPQETTRLAAEIARVMAQPFVVDGKAIQLGASIGCACHPQDGGTPEVLMRAADVALQHAKLHSRGRAVTFDRSMEAERLARHQIYARLRAALASNDFGLHFQPVYEAASGRLRGFEALVRLTDDEGRAISPAEFIPVAEETGLIAEIGLWVLRESCRVARQWPEELFVAVNLSPAQFAAGGMAARVRDALAWSDLKPQRLELEVTESLLITDTEKVLRELNEIKALGPSLALDDFGTGYSSLSYLWRFPFDKLKVDRSFMADLTAPARKSREILATIIALGRVLNLTITAEGVETEEQAAVLRELECDLVQGFLFGRPQPAREVSVTIAKSFGPPAPVHLITGEAMRRVGKAR